MVASKGSADLAGVHRSLPETRGSISHLLARGSARFTTTLKFHWLAPASAQWGPLPEQLIACRESAPHDCYCLTLRITANV